MFAKPTLFQRVAPSLADGYFLYDEVADRMMDRLGLINIKPNWVLDAGAGVGRQLGLLTKQYPDAHYLVVDLEPTLLMHGVAKGYLQSVVTKSRSAFSKYGQGILSRLLPRKAVPVAHTAFAISANNDNLPLTQQSIDLVWSNMSLHWASDIAAWIREWQRVLRPQGVLMFSLLGGDTLKEVKAAFAALGYVPPLLKFQDLHDVGDVLVNHGFADPVMDVERLVLEYRDPSRLLQDLRAAGGRFTTLSGIWYGKNMIDRLWQQLLLQQREQVPEGLSTDNVVRITIEVVYGHAWAKPLKNKAYQPVVFHKSTTKAE
jgi:malonyl-CoA O-methyltransferase